MFGDHNNFDSGSGFINSQSDGNTQKRGQTSNIMPCTIAQIFYTQQNDDKFYHDGIELRQVSLLGVVRSSKQSNTNICYELDDHTGPLIEVKFFVDIDENTNTNVEILATGIYIHVIGHLRSFGGKKMITAFKINPITDFNELTCHLAEVVHAHMYHTKKPESMVSDRRLDNMSLRSEDAVPSISADQGLSVQHLQVLNVIRRSMDEIGMNINIIYEQLKGMPRKVIDAAIDFMSSEGHIYSTIDDFHYKATDIS